MKKIVLIPLLATVLVACDNKPNAADNTSRNVQDRENAAISPLNQSESESDRSITQKIRQLVMDSASLSTNGKNVKIITINGTVTLRGPVESDDEKITIERLASNVSGVVNVDNQLEVINK